MNKLKAVFLSGIFACIFATQIFAEPVTMVDGQGNMIRDDFINRPIVNKQGKELKNEMIADHKIDFSTYYYLNKDKAMTSLNSNQASKDTILYLKKKDEEKYVEIKEVLKDKDDIETDLYYLHFPNRQMEKAPNNLGEGHILYFKKKGTEKYVQANYLENKAVRTVISSKRNGIPINYKNAFKNLQLCAALYDELGAKEFKSMRDIGCPSFAHDQNMIKNQIIDKIFDALPDINSSRTNIINPIKRNLKAIIITNQNWNINHIFNAYMLLKICFHKDRANGEPVKALKYLLKIEDMPHKSDLERAIIDNSYNKFTTHIAKHFVHYTITTEKQDDFFKIKQINPTTNKEEEISVSTRDKPQENRPYTFFSYGDNEYNYQAAKNRICKDNNKLLKQIISKILEVYNVEFSYSSDGTTANPCSHLKINLVQRTRKKKLLDGDRAKYEYVKDGFKDGDVTPVVYQIADYIKRTDLIGNKIAKFFQVKPRKDTDKEKQITIVEARTSNYEAKTINNSPTSLDEKNVAVFFELDNILRADKALDYAGSLYPYKYKSESEDSRDYTLL